MPMRIARISSSESACAPRAARRSRGRMASGHSWIGTCDVSVGACRDRSLVSRRMKLEGVLPVLAGLIAAGALNVLVLSRALRRKTPVPGQRISYQTLVDVISLSLLTLVLTAAWIIDLLLLRPTVPAVGGALLWTIGALIAFVVRWMFRLLPDTPPWMTGMLTAIERLLLGLGVATLALGLVRAT